MGKFLNRKLTMEDFRVIKCYPLTEEQVKRVNQKINQMIDRYEAEHDWWLDNSTIDCCIESDPSGWYVRLQDVHCYETINMVERMGDCSEYQID